MMRERAGKFHRSLVRCLACVVAVVSAACSTTPVVERQPSRASSPPSESVSAPTVPTSTPAAMFTRAEWNDLPGWRDDNAAEAWPALLASCSVLAGRALWTDVCTIAKSMRPSDGDAARRFFEQHFIPYSVASTESGDEGLITGYYEALLLGSRKPTERYRYPVYAMPDDLVVVELGSVYPDLRNMRLRGRLDGRRLVPYFDRAQIDGPDAPLRGKEIAWVDDPFDLFFLQIQGSGRIVLDTGETIRVGYAEQNGHPYRAIGRVLIDRGELTREEVSMQSIRAWLLSNRDRSAALLNTNPSYVFFRELPATADGPPGALGVALTPGRSIAVDPRHVPLGLPVFISASSAGGTRTLNRLTVAQDTGGAIRGAVRADFFWGAGETAEREAGHMKDRLRMWVLLPHGHPIP